MPLFYKKPHIVKKNLRILIIGNSLHGGEDRQMQIYVDLFNKTAESAKFKPEVHYCFLDEVLFWLSQNSTEVIETRNNKPFHYYDLIIFRGKIRAYGNVAYCLSKYLRSEGKQFFNNYESYRNPFTKVSQIMAMRELNLKYPATLYSASKELLLQNANKYLSFPLICKDNLGSHGSHNYLVHSLKDLEKILRQYPKTSFLLQEYIPNDCDYRILIAGNNHLIIKRQATGASHLNNTSQGAKAELIKSKDFSAATIKQAHEFAATLNMVLAGVDVIQNNQTGQTLFLEINSQPQIASGAFTIEKQELLSKLLAEIKL